MPYDSEKGKGRLVNPMDLSNKLFIVHDLPDCVLGRRDKVGNKTVKTPAFVEFVY